MAKPIDIIIDDFSRGMTADPREKDKRFAQLVKGFDAHTYNHKLVPFRSSEAADIIPDTRRAVNFLYANSRLYALGVVSGTSRAAINYKDSFGGTSWTTPSNNESSAGSRDEEVFGHYKNYIYGARSSRYIWRHGDIVTGSPPTWSDSYKDLADYTDVFSSSYSSSAAPLVHSKDDMQYFAFDNWIIKNNAGTFTAGTAPALTLPADRSITSLCEYGNYLAIATRPKTGVGNSRVYLWDRDSSLATLSESIEWGEGNLQILEEIEGALIGISYVSSNAFLSKIVFREYTGSQARVFRELISEATYTAGDLPLSKQKVGNYLYFLLTITIGGTKHQGLWKVGRPVGSSSLSVVMDRTPNNDTALSSGTLEGFLVVGDYAFIAYTSSATYAITSTNDSATYSATAYFDTIILKSPDSTTLKLVGVTLMTEPLPTAGQATLRVKKDEETSYTAVLTNSTDDSVSKSAVRDASGATLPQGEEFTFRIESTGGAAITGLAARFEMIDNDVF